MPLRVGDGVGQKHEEPQEVAGLCIPILVFSIGVDASIVIRDDANAV